MAARRRRCDTWSNQALSDKDLRDVINELHPLVHKYKLFGIQLGEIEYSDIKRIEAECTQSSDRLLEVISLRLKKTKALTWGDIISALKSPSVDESQIAEGIRKRYGSLTSESEKLSEKPQNKSFTSETLLKRTQQKVEIVKKRSEPEKGKATHEAKSCESKVQLKGRERSSQVRKELSEQRAQKEVPEKSESESSASSSEEIVKANKSETHSEDSSEQEQNSDEEVRGKEYQKTSEQTTGDEYASESETEVKEKQQKPKGLKVNMESKKGTSNVWQVILVTDTRAVKEMLKNGSKKCQKRVKFNRLQ
ncbi:hypothetical protein GBAR_LOCUS27679, partial [Geodia barretti]